MSYTYLKIKRFKCFQEQIFKIGNLTVLAGRNSMGKSSVTQALRLLRHSSANERSSGEIHLNSSGFRFGTYDGIINSNMRGSSSGNFEIGYSKSESDISMVGFYPAEDSDDCEYVKCKGGRNPLLKKKSSLTFSYLSAERYGPRLIQEETEGHLLSQFGVGVNGEFSAEVLVNNLTSRISKELVHESLKIDKKNINALLTSNLEKWMSSIVGNINIRADRPKRLAMPSIEFKTSDEDSDWQFPTNFGFGISYALPIVLAALLLEKNGHLLVDSPEAHLHPAAQTSIALFLARVAATGNKRIIVETHSDHILDGFRLAVADRSHPLQSAQSIFHYLDRNASGDVTHQEIIPREDGTLPRWPIGFFDQSSLNLRRLANAKSN